MKILHIVPELNEANGVFVVVRLLARESGDAAVVGLDEGLRRIDDGDVEEVWVHGMWLPKEWAACRRVLRAGKRLVRMTHGSLSPVYLKCQSPFKKWLVGPIERWALGRCAKIVATCDAEREWIEAYLGKKCPEIVVKDVKRFFDFSRVERVEGDESVFNTEAQRHRGAEKDELHLLYLGRRHPLKGVEYLERAVKELNHGIHGTHGNVELKIVSNAFGKELEKVWEWCDVLVLPTLSENFGLVVAEALERGKRVITTDGAPVWGENGSLEVVDFSRKERIGRKEGEMGSLELEKREELESEIWSGYSGRLLYLKGYRDGSDEERVELLRKAILFLAAKNA